MRHLRGPIIAGIFLALVFAFSPPIDGLAAETGFSFVLDRSSAAAGDTVRLNASVRDGAEDAAGFRLRVSYDGDTLRFLGTETTGPANGTLRTNSASNPIYSVYVCNVSGENAPVLSGTIVTFLFQVRDGAEAGSTQISAQADQVCDFDGSPLDAGGTGDVSLNITSLSDEALLTGLVPSQGMLRPAFSPETSDYSLSVDSGVDSVSFEADAAAGGTVKISRKSLKAAGSDTQIAVTVTSADKSTQRQYFILVSRAAKAAASSHPASAATADSSRPPQDVQTSGKAEGLSSRGGRESLAGSSRETASSRTDASSQPQGTAGTAQSSPQLPASALAAQAHAEGHPAALNLVQNRMPAYAAGMFACVFCMFTGIAVYFWLCAKPKV